MSAELRCGKALCMNLHCRDCFQTVEEVQACRREREGVAYGASGIRSMEWMRGFAAGVEEARPTADSTTIDEALSIQSECREERDEP